MSFITKKPQNRGIKSGLPLVVIHSVHFLNKLSDNLSKNLGENYFYHSGFYR